jgi:Cys-rich protein (TIGR01571 family)
MAEGKHGWSTPFCSFFEEVGPFLLICLAGKTGIALVQCHDQNAINEDKGGVMAYFCVYCLECYGAAYNRMKVRDRFNIKGNYFVDCLIYACDLGLCAAVQEYRETKIRATHHK